MRGRVPQWLVDLRLFALGLFEPGGVGVARGDGGEVLRVHALSRGQRLPRPDPRIERLAQLDQQRDPAAAGVPAGLRSVCRKDLPGLGLNTPAGKATANAEALKYARCIRSNGVPNFPDPNGQGVLVIQTGDVQLNSPAFQKAQAACKSLDSGFGEASVSATPAP